MNFVGIPLFEFKLYSLLFLFLGIVVLYEISNELIYNFSFYEWKFDQNVNIDYLHITVLGKCK